MEIGQAANANTKDANAASAKEQAEAGEADHGKEQGKRTKLAKADRKAENRRQQLLIRQQEMIAKRDQLQKQLSELDSN